jgi:hypothetical protein
MVLSTDPKLLYNTFSSNNPEPQMRYNPATDRALNIEEIAAQCRNAVLKASAKRALDVAYAEILENARWENDVLIPA